jgi:hypothetical protein
MLAPSTIAACRPALTGCASRSGQGLLRAKHSHGVFMQLCCIQGNYRPRAQERRWTATLIAKRRAVTDKPADCAYGTLLALIPRPF